MSEGTVRSAVLNFFSDGQADTELTLTNGELVIFSGIAPIPKTHQVRVEGESKSRLAILKEIHPTIPEQVLRERILIGKEEATWAQSIQDIATEVHYIQQKG